MKVRHAISLSATLLILAVALFARPIPHQAYAADDNNVNYPVTIVFGAYNLSGGGWFSPDPLYVKAGDTVTWTNQDLVVHTVTEGNVSGVSAPEFDSQILAPLQSFNFTFTKAGTYHYFDHIRPFINGTVIVGNERSPLPGVVVGMEKLYYTIGDTVKIAGKVTNLVDGQQVIIQIFNPDGVAYRFDQVPPSVDNGSFSYSAQIAGQLGKPGDYKVVALYGDFRAETGFRLLAPLAGLTINAEAQESSPLNMWSVTDFITLEGNRHFIVGFTPNTVILPQGISYTITVQDYLDSKFDHWENGSTERTRVIDLSGNTTITAHYKNGLSIRGFSPLAYSNADEQQTKLTVNALSLDDGKPLHMWIRIENIGSDDGGTSYKVTVQDYSNLRFDHWDDGSKDRTRVLTIGQATTITTYYNTS